MTGWVKVHRQLLESEIFANSKSLKIFLWLILKANIKPRFVPLKIGAGESTVKIEYAQLLFGRFKAEEELGIDGSTIYKWLKKMEEMKMILIQSNSHYSIITICNFELYQGVEDTEVTAEEQPRNNQSTAEEQPRNTPKKVKKEEESKEWINVVATFLQVFKTVTGKKRIKVVDDKTQKQLKILLESYTMQDIEIAIKNSMADSYHIETKYKYITPEFITRPDKFQRFVSVVSYTTKPVEEYKGFVSLEEGGAKNSLGKKSLFESQIESGERKI